MIGKILKSGAMPAGIAAVSAVAVGAVETMPMVQTAAIVVLGVYALIMDIVRQVARGRKPQPQRVKLPDRHPHGLRGGKMLLIMTAVTALLLASCLSSVHPLLSPDGLKAVLDVAGEYLSVERCDNLMVAPAYEVDGLSPSGPDADHSLRMIAGGCGKYAVVECPLTLDGGFLNIEDVLASCYIVGVLTYDQAATLEGRAAN